MGFKKQIKIVAVGSAVLVVILGSAAVFMHRRCHESVNYPQGGMWLPEQMPQHAEALKELKLDFPISGISDFAQSPLAASVSLGGCSASFVSPRGLIITNHHCVVGILNHLGKDGTDYQTQGFLAKSEADEKAAPPTQSVFVTLSYEDVTEQIRDGLELIPEPAVRTQTVEQRIDALVREREAIDKQADPAIQVEVKGFYRNSRFFLIRKKEIRDIRLVYAPHEGIGNYGGDVDNWHWPRHTGDFAFLRAYVSKTGQSTPYHPDNVPYEPKDFLKLASEPLNPGDLVFVMGYPGSTERWDTLPETKAEMENHYPHNISRSRGFISLLENFENQQDKQQARFAKSMLPRLRNYLPLWEGELKGMKTWGILTDKQRDQEALLKWVSENSERKAKYGALLENPASGETTDTESKARQKQMDRALKEFITWGFHSKPPMHLLRSAMLIVRMAEERPKKDADREPDFKERHWDTLRTSLGKTYQDQFAPGVEKAVLGFFLDLARAAGNTSLLAAVAGQPDPTSDQLLEKINEMYSKTALLSVESRTSLFDTASLNQLKKSSDPAIVMGLALNELWKQYEQRLDEEYGREVVDTALWAEARAQALSSPQAPDANSTLRISFGTVRDYCAGIWKKPYPTFTYASEVRAKHTGKTPFDATEKVVQKIDAKDYRNYASSSHSDVPVAFLSDLDITGGNSGSPVLNRRGELAGVAFDGVVEAMASDKKYLPHLSRTISVDTRYILWVLDVVENADWLVKELNYQPNAATTAPGK
jgi:hypothetical protein